MTKHKNEKNLRLTDLLQHERMASTALSQVLNANHPKKKQFNIESFQYRLIVNLEITQKSYLVLHGSSN